ncbi:MAG: type II secretion system GspH family protein [Patescibacteria group bacterium]|nr:type II secretion system GspH family protein [Patescibacteria group bacterium]
MRRDQNKNNKGFTLIELLVVVAIISLLTSIALISLMSARQKSRNTKRLADMTSMNTALELFFAANRGYPDTNNGVPAGLIPHYASTLPAAPTPADGACATLTHAAGACGDTGQPPCDIPSNTYYYFPQGTSYTLNVDGVPTTLYPSYSYYFCLGNTTGDFPAGEHIMTPKGVK